jgi:hypothetical protein
MEQQQFMFGGHGAWVCGGGGDNSSCLVDMEHVCETTKFMFLRPFAATEENF